MRRNASVQTTPVTLAILCVLMADVCPTGGDVIMTMIAVMGQTRRAVVGVIATYHGKLYVI